MQAIDLEAIKVILLRTLSRLDETGVLPPAVEHPNGYRKILLHQRKDGRRIRLHHWPARVSAEDPHDHRWSYSAVLLAGQMTERLYRRALDVSHPSFAEYRYSMEENIGTFAFLRHVHLHAEVERRLLAGEPRSRVSSEIHSLRADTEALSLMLTDPPSTNYSSVFAVSVRTYRDVPISAPKQVRDSLVAALNVL